MSRNFKLQLSVCAAAASILLASPAAAQERAFDIPAQDAAAAISAFARQAGLQVVAPADGLQGIRTPALKGQLDARAALQRLIAGTGLQVVSDSNGVIVLRRAPGAAPTADADTVGEVVVTAQRRVERALDVPIAVTVVGAAQAQAAGVVSTRDLAFVTPGLVGGQTGFAFLPSIRGISSTGTGAGDEANVALYVDNVYIATSGVTAFHLANIDHVEVLKGPQGTLFGRNATGGAIRVVTSDPGDAPEFSASISGGLSKPFSREVSLYGAAPVTDALSASLSGYYYDDDGYLDNADPAYSGDRQGSMSSYILRGKLLYAPNDRLKIIGAADYGQSISGVELTTTFINNVSAFKNIVGVIPATRERQVATNEQNFDKADNYGASVSLEYRFDRFTVSSISAARRSSLGIALDNDRSNLTLNRTAQRNDVETLSQELNLASNFEGPFNFIAGAYVFDEQAKNPFINTYAAAISPVTNGVRTVLRPLALGTSITAGLQTRSYSAFGEATYALTDRFSVVAGVRYSIDYKKAYSTNLVVPSPVLYSENDWDNVSYRLTAKYRLAADQLLYATNSTGFKSGNINAPTYPFPTPHDQVLPEEVIAYEVGYKARLFDGRLDLAASAFHYDYKNIQLTTNNALSAAAGRVGINILQNAARGEITGADLELAGRFDQHWGWQLGVSWLPTAKYADFRNGLHFEAQPGGLGAVSVSSDLSGSRILRSPEATVNLGLTYRTGLMGGELQLAANYFHTSSMFLAVGEAIEQASYDVLGAQAGWTDPSGRYTVSAWGRNLTDAAYYVSGNVNSGGMAAVWSRPREVGLRLRAKY